jgi:hypothetical protein
VLADAAEGMAGGTGNDAGNSADKTSVLQAACADGRRQ